MKYSLTPLNALCALLVVVEIILFTSPEILKHDHDGFIHVFIIPVIFIGLIGDYILQMIFKKRSWVALIELILILVVSCIWHII
jgi:hypothetical protein